MSMVHFRCATPDDDETIVELCLALNAEDPGQPVDADQVRRTLSRLRAEPLRGRAVVAQLDGQVVGYALLVSFWSNEYGGEICDIDELYVRPAQRGGGIATELFNAVAEDRSLWPTRPVALELEATPDNVRARAFYERLGFAARNALLRKRLPPTHG
jgi:GNAT superfamily N-acetyltransferase